MSSTVTPAATAGSSPVKRKAQVSPFERSRRWVFMPFVFPALVVYAVVMVLPTLFTIWISFNQWAGAGPMEWVGTKNYERMFNDPAFTQAFYNTLWIVFGVGIGVFVVAFTLTMLLYDMVGRKWIRAVIFIPSLVPAIAISILWGFLFNPDGLINNLLHAAGVHSEPAWLSHGNVFKTILLGMVWMSSGTYTVILMAAVDRIPPEMYEAAELEGATPLQRMRYVTLPMIWDIVSVCIVLWCVGALKTFEFLLTFSPISGTVPPRSIWNFAMYSYASAFPGDAQGNYGVAAASGLVVLFLTGILTVLARRVIRRDAVTF